MSRRPAWWLTVLAKIWPITWLSAKATRIPIVGKLVELAALPLFSGKNLNVTYIPINEGITGRGSTPLPILVVEELIRRSSHRVIINRCTCRDARQRPSHPVQIGCTLLGEGTKEIDPRIARHVSREDAIEHLHTAVRAGLIPMTGRVRVDNFIWGVRDRGQMLTICYCCRCCCTILASGKYLPAGATDSLVRIEGLRIEVDPDLCTGCGTCVTECFMGAIHLRDGRAHHDEGLCKGCGRCVSVCPQSAVRIDVEDLDAAANEMISRMDTLADYK